MPDNNLVPRRIARAQAVCALCAAALLLPVMGATAAWSAVLAGGISALSSWYAGRKVFNSKAQTARQFVGNLYQAQALKLLLVAALFCIVFSLAQVNFPVFITTYAATLTIYGFGLASSKTGLKAGSRGGFSGA